MRLSSVSLILLAAVLFGSLGAARTGSAAPLAPIRAPQPAAPVPAGPGDGTGELTLLHNNDGESTLLPITNTVQLASSRVNLPTSGVAAFKTVTDDNIDDARNNGHAVVNVYAGDAFLASATLACSLPPNPATTPIYDAVAQKQIPYTAHIIGNHEFDYNPDFLKRFIDEFSGDQPFLSANLNFSNEPSYAGLLDEDGLVNGDTGDLIKGPNDRVIGRSMVYTDTATGQRFGIVGATTPQLPTISSPRNVTVTANITDTALAVQGEVDRLYTLGVRKIIFVSHLQDVRNDRELVKRLTKVDIAVAGGGDELLASTSVPTSTQLLPGEAARIAGTYPLVEKDADNRDVYIVTTAGNYKYLGRLDVTFDANGEVMSIDTVESYPRRVIPKSAAATQLGLNDAVEPDPAITTSVIQPVQQCLRTFAETPIVRSEVQLDLRRDSVRGRETNAGNLIADSFLAAYDRYREANGLPARGPANPVIAVQNGGGIRQNAGDFLPTSGTPGIISRLDTLNVLPFDNTMTVVRNVTPADLKTIFERSAAVLPGGQFLQVSGITVTLNLRQPVNSRVTSLILSDGTALIRGGTVVAGAPSVSVVTNNFTAGGGDNYPTFANNPNKVNLRDSSNTLIGYEQVWREYLQSFPVQNGVPTISATDRRYQAAGEGRILLLVRQLFLAIVDRN